MGMCLICSRMGRYIRVYRRRSAAQCAQDLREQHVAVLLRYLDQAHVRVAADGGGERQRTLRRTTSRADADVKTELDLRGQTVEEALGNLGLFIDKCVLNNISEVRIIHGKGTGALRTAVQEELRHHPNVAEYRLGVYGEGENGVTIAKLK